jgi:hypothetical protein
MAFLRTLLQMRSEVRSNTDQEQGEFVSDAEIDEWINQGITQVWQDLITVDPDRGTVETTITTVTGQEHYALPPNFLSLRGMDYPTGGTGTGTRHTDMLSYEFKERNDFQHQFSALETWLAPYRYRVARGDVGGSSVRLSLRPVPKGAVDLVVHYVATPKLLLVDGDSFDGIIGFEVYPVAWASLQVRTKAEEDASTELAILQATEKRIQTEAPRRDRSAQKRIADVNRLRGSDPRYHHQY